MFPNDYSANPPPLCPLIFAAELLVIQAVDGDIGGMIARPRATRGRVFDPFS